MTLQFLISNAKSNNPDTDKSTIGIVAVFILVTLVCLILAQYFNFFSIEMAIPI